MTRAGKLLINTMAERHAPDATEELEWKVVVGGLSEQFRFVINIARLPISSSTMRKCIQWDGCLLFVRA